MQYTWLNDYLMALPGTMQDFKVEWGWRRYMLDGKMYAAVCKGANGEDSLITLKLDPLEGELLRGQFPDIIPGYYMNKQHWNSVRIGGEVPDDLMRDMLGKSYRLVLKSLSKKRQAEIAAEREQAEK